MLNRSRKVRPSEDKTLDGAFFSKKLVGWYTQNERPLPWRTLWKAHKNPWHIWVSEIMLQQTVIKSVLPVYEKFLKQFPSPDALASAQAEEVRLAVRGLGYYRRFVALHRACKELSAAGTGLPKTHDDWLNLPGIGAYTAAAIASITANEPHGVVDGNVERVLCRMLDIRTEPNLPPLKKMFKKMMDEMCQKTVPGSLNQAVMELGQTICTPISPDCTHCPVSSRCQSFANSSQHLAPAPKKQKESVDVGLRLNIIVAKNGVLLIKRPEGAKFLPGTWGFLTEIESGRGWHSDGKVASLKLCAGEDVGRIKHNITKHKISATVVKSQAKAFKLDETIRVAKFTEVERNLVSNLDRKAWNVLLRSTKQHALKT